MSRRRSPAAAAGQKERGAIASWPPARELSTLQGVVHRAWGAPARRCMLRVSGDTLTFAIPTGVPPLHAGDEVTLIVLGEPQTGEVLGLVNHTTVDGENYVRATARSRPSVWDGVVLSAALVGAVLGLGVRGIVPFVVLVAVYVVIAGVVPAACREWLARRVDRLIEALSREGWRASAPDGQLTASQKGGDKT